MKIDIIKIPLQAHSRFHFGDFRLDSNIALGTTTEIAHSDLLFSALVNNYNELTGKGEDFIKLFNENQICISSVFYYLEKGDQTIYLLPKPVFLDLYSPRDGQHKKRNRIRYISHNVWKKELNPGDWIDKKGEVAKDYLLIQGGEILITQEEADNFDLNEKSTVFYTKEQPNSPIRKENPDQSIFYETDLYIAQLPDVAIGMYFMYKADNTFKNKLLRAVNVMRYTGLGGNRTVIGRTMIADIKEDYLELEEGERLTNVSLINPKDTAELSKIEYYKTVLRGGVYKNKVVRMISEGALLKDTTIEGQLVEIGTFTDDAGTEKNIYRNGKAFIIPCKLPKNQQDEQNHS